MIKIKYKDKDLYDSKSFVVLGLGETSITLTEGAEELVFIFDFIRDKAEKEFTLAYESIDSKTLKIKLTNWETHSGSTLHDPVQVGQFLNRKLYTIFNVVKIGSKEMKQVTVSFYLGDRV